MSPLYKVEQLAQSLINQDFTITTIYGEIKVVNVGKLGYTFVFDNAKKRAGVCRYNKKQIGLSKPICEKNIDRLDSIEDTIRHEIAHAISKHVYGRKGGGHGSYWKHTATQVGAKPQRCYTKEKYEPVKSKYTLSCPCRKNTQPIHRKTRRLYSCDKCSGGKYNPEYKLELIQNY